MNEPSASPRPRPRLFTVLGGGNVGIGTTTPAAQVQVGADTSYGRIYVNGAGSGSSPLTTARPTTDDAQVLIGRPGGANADSGGLEFLSSPGGNGYGWKVTAPDVAGATIEGDHQSGNDPVLP